MIPTVTFEQVFPWIDSTSMWSFRESAKTSVTETCDILFLHNVALTPDLFLCVSSIPLADKMRAKLNLAADDTLPLYIQANSLESRLPSMERVRFQPLKTLFPPTGAGTSVSIKARTRNLPKPKGAGAFIPKPASSHFSIHLFFFLFFVMSNTAGRLFSEARRLNRRPDLLIGTPTATFNASAFWTLDKNFKQKRRDSEARWNSPF